MQKYFINFLKKIKDLRYYFNFWLPYIKVVWEMLLNKLKKIKLVYQKFQIFLNSNTSRGCKYSISLQKLFLKYISKSEPDYIFLSADRF